MVEKLADLQRILARFDETGDGTPLLADTTTALAKSLMPEAFADDKVMLAVARLHMLRYEARGYAFVGESSVPLQVITYKGEERFALAYDTGDDHDAAADAASALSLFAMLHVDHPEIVPEPLAKDCELLRTGTIKMTDLAEQRASELLWQFDQTGDVEVVREAAGKFLRAAEQHLLPADRRAELLVRAGATIIELASATGDVDFFEPAEVALRGAVAIGESIGSVRSSALVYLSQIVAERTGAFDQAITLARRALATVTSDNDREFARGNLAALLIRDAGEEAPPELVDEVIGMLRTVVTDGDPSASYHSAAKANLAILLSRSQPTAADDRRELLLTAMRQLPRHHPQRAALAVVLARLIDDWTEPAGQEAGSEVIDALTVAVNRPTPDPEQVATLAVQLYLRYLVGGNNDDLTQANDLMRGVIDDSTDIGSHIAFGQILADSYLEGGDVRALREAIDRARELVARHPGDPKVLVAYGRLLEQEHRVADDPGAVLDEAITVMRQALEATPESHPQYDRRLIALANALLKRSDQVGPTDGIDDVLAAIHARVEADPNRAQIYHSSLSVAEMMLWEQSARGDLTAAIEAARAALAHRGLDRFDRATSLNGLAISVRELFLRTGDLRQLDEAIDLARRSVAGLPSRHPDMERSAGTLASLLQSRYTHTGDTRALEDAIASARLAEASRLPGTRPDPVVLNTLGGCLLARAARTRTVDDANEAVEVMRRCAEATPPGHPRHGRHLSNLAAALNTRHRLTGDAADHDEALALYADAVDATSTESPFRVLMVTNSAITHLNEHTEEGRERAIALLRDALTLPGNTGATMLHLGRALIEQSPDSDEAADLLRRASDQVSEPVRLRIDAAWQLGELGAGRDDPVLALDGYGRAVELLELLAWRGLSRSDREGLIRHHRKLASRAAAWALTAGQPERAVELLERGQSVLLRQAASGHNRYDDLHAADPELADQLARVQSMLEVDPFADLEPGQLEARDALVREWTALVDQARALPGFADFLAPPTFADLQPGEAEPPIVLVNSDQTRSDALIVDHRGITVVPLPRVRRAELDFCVLAWETALNRLLGEDASTLRLAQLLRAREVVSWTLGWLWDEIASPVLAALGIDGPPTGRWPRLRWYPVGYLKFLPLHAAGHHGIPGENVIDRAVSSYVTTLRDLYPNWGRTPATKEPLLVAMANTPGHRQLAGVDRERRAFAERFPAAPVLLDDAATMAATVAALRECGWAHFACHTDIDNLEPSAGRLLLHDGSITIADLRAVRTARGRGTLAILLTCASARVAGGMAEENISLATAMQVVGFHHVIGTMWTVDDETAADLGVDLYKRLAPTSAVDPALALHETVRAARAAHPQAPLGWAGLVHLGER
ncbi:CHAT domain-containing protein [Glycomyces sp. NPDC047010]|uniref:CHAT domain-containing protein n=1 Tax=Glycomyces sp. NPDC047010 TaxID=3155023 RepID=UPI003408EDCC